MADCRNQALSGRGCSREALQSMPPAMAYVPYALVAAVVIVTAVLLAVFFRKKRGR